MGLQLAGGNDEGLGPRHTEQELGAHGSGKRGQVCLEKTLANMRSQHVLHQEELARHTDMEQDLWRNVKQQATWGRLHDEFYT